VVARRQEVLLALREVARLLSVSPRTVRCWIAAEGLPSIRLGRLLRFDPGDVSRWLSARRD